MKGREIRLSKNHGGNSGVVRHFNDCSSEFVRLSHDTGDVRDELKLFRTGKEIHLDVQSMSAVEEKSNLVYPHALIA